MHKCLVLTMCKSTLIRLLTSMQNFIDAVASICAGFRLDMDRLTGYAKPCAGKKTPRTQHFQDIELETQLPCAIETL